PSVSPLMVSDLMRDFPPAVTRTVLFGTSSQRAMSFSTAALASPSAGTARTPAASACPSALGMTPSTPSIDDFGVRRTRTMTHPFPARHGCSAAVMAPSPRGEEEVAQRAQDHALHEEARQEQHYGRDVDGAQIGHHVADRPQ